MEQRSKKILNIQMIIKLVLAAVMLGLSVFLLKGDVWTFWTWWLLAAVMGFAAMPVTGRLFWRFEDKGWIFSKVLAIAATGFITWLLVSIRLVPFHTLTCVGVTIACAVSCLFLLKKESREKLECFPVDNISLIYWEEMLFFAAFLMWTYLAGFHPAAYGTEKFMDYGFMEAMMRSNVLPARDLWYSQGHINYYYGGQYFAVFLTKLSHTKVELTYNLMRTFVAGLAFIMPFSLVYQMMTDRMKGQLKSERIMRGIPFAAGVTAGTAVSIAGNMHYVIYARIIPLIEKLTGQEVSSYWFPDATRYIGYNPYREEDRTIHEFPCYSFILGDLHAHVVNIMFVLLIIALLYVWLRGVRKKTVPVDVTMKEKGFWKEQLFMPHLLVVSVILGMFQWTNFWDFVIYYTVTLGTVLFANIIRFQGKIKKILAVTVAQMLEIYLIAYLVILPFTLQFDTMVDGVGIAKYHSYFYQLMVLWGLPAVLVITFIAAILWEKLRNMEHKSLYRLMKAIRTADLFAILLGICAIGLVVIPELVYVRDIYENGNARANTMFKLTYQAYIIFALTMGYGIFRLLVVSKQKLFKIISGICLFFLTWTVGYFGISVDSWFGNVLDTSKYQGLYALGYLETDFPEDAAAIQWLKENIKGAPVVLEANGDSYTGYERVSASTGLPTILGWYVHEWLWRNDTDDLNRKRDDIAAIYTSEDELQVRNLLNEYDVSYIFVGSKEKEKYEDTLNNELLQSLGEIMFMDEDSGTYIVKVD
nr:DUF2298 domain-containing protein [uncultured Blautia sp.]